MIARMFFHWCSNQQTLGLVIGRHRTTVGSYLSHWCPKWANVGMDLAILDVNVDYQNELPSLPLWLAKIPPDYGFCGDKGFSGIEALLPNVNIVLRLRRPL